MDSTGPGFTGSSHTEQAREAISRGMARVWQGRRERASLVVAAIDHALECMADAEAYIDREGPTLAPAEQEAREAAAVAVAEQKIELMREAMETARRLASETE